MKLTRLIAAALTAVCIFTLTSCKQEDTQTTANDYPVHVADTVVDHRPKKVVSLAPALTDTLFQLQIARTGGSHQRLLRSACPAR